MAASTSLPLQDLATNIYSRKLLLLSLSSHRLLSSAPIPAIGTDASYSPSDDYSPGDNSFDSNVLMVFSVLLCALICSLGLNSIIRCVLRCSIFVVASDDPSSSSTASTRLVNTGVKRKALKTFPVVKYSPELNLQCLDTDCVICLSEFIEGEQVRLLPGCHHGFHVRCIDKWLSSHLSCPTCRHCLIETYQKIKGCTSQATDSSSECNTRHSPQQLEITIEPLVPEGFTRFQLPTNQLYS